jgi:predicted anti-sigma-YlaC factor YlaD
MCEEVRVALSARLDGEDPGPQAGPVEQHLAGCAACRDWQARAQRLDEVVARREQAPVPDLTERIAAAIAAAPAPEAAAPTGSARVRGSARLRGAEVMAALELRARRQILRLAVAVAAGVQLALALPALFDPVGAAAGIHTTREMASFDLAVAVGFLIAAYRPARARAFIPVALVLAGCLAVTSGVDLARGTTIPSHEIGHLVAVVQAGLLWALGRAERAQRDTRPDTAAIPA